MGEHILSSMVEEENRRADGHDSDISSSTEEDYHDRGFRYYWDHRFCDRGHSCNTVAEIEHMLEVVVDTCKDSTECESTLARLCKIKPACLGSAKWEAFVSRQSL